MKECPTITRNDQTVLVHIVLKQIDQGDHVISVHASFERATEEADSLNKIEVEDYHPYDGYRGSHYVDSFEVRISQK